MIPCKYYYDLSCLHDAKIKFARMELQISKSGSIPFVPAAGYMIAFASDQQLRDMDFPNGADLVVRGSNWNECDQRLEVYLEDFLVDIINVDDFVLEINNFLELGFSFTDECCIAGDTGSEPIVMPKNGISEGWVRGLLMAQQRDRPGESEQSVFGRGKNPFISTSG